MGAHLRQSARVGGDSHPSHLAGGPRKEAAAPAAGKNQKLAKARAQPGGKEDSFRANRGADLAATTALEAGKSLHVCTATRAEDAALAQTTAMALVKSPPNGC